MITFDFVPFHMVAAEIAPNVERHYGEMNKGDDMGTPEIDWDYYLQISNLGICKAAVVRDEGKLVGYSVYTVSTNPRYKRSVEAHSDATFVEKDYRGKPAMDLLNFADEKLKDLGVSRVMYITNDDMFGKILGRMNFKPDYTIWEKKYG